MQLTHLSAISLAVALGAPAYAQQSASPAGMTGASSGHQQQSRNLDQLEERMSKAGVEDPKEFKGRLVRAQSPEGHPVMLVVGPENMQGDKSLDNFKEDKIRGQLARSGFSNIDFVEDSKLMRGKMGDDRAILALAGDSGWRGTPGAAQSQPNRDRLNSDFEKIGLSERKEFKGKLVRAQDSAGQTTFVLVGPSDFKGDESVNLSASELTKLESGFRSAEVVQDVTLVRGKMDDMTVIALAGQALAQSTSTMGAAGARNSTTR